jgi:hypothetical protein
MAKVQTFPSAWEGVLSGLVEENDGESAVLRRVRTARHDTI